MSNRPWFKAFAADYLLDSKVDALPLEVEGFLWRMWSVCHLDGSCPADPAELARKTRRPLAFVLKYRSYYEPFFELKGGSYVSPRMEKEKRRSEVNSRNVSNRYKQTTSEFRSTNRSTVGSDFVVPPSDSDSDSDFNLGSKEGIDVEVHEIAALYPRINDAFHLPHETALAIARAVARDGRDLVWAGTKNVQDAVAGGPPGELKFLPAAAKFFNESNYRNPPEFWERNTNGKPKPSASADRSERTKQNILDGIAASIRTRAESDRAKREGGASQRTGS